ncbi:hypothetical protein CC78DRAFT_593463 [Lojkania enalia]|uniref:Heterokaryon incompatibility domain-containing protein n=1 Tax=Lojkania enalia TaxID=147567 RepID=A0A9P4JYR5_9PLEO|nr:hypothetical protein CC78DRAFT_593463 [Didymosphaeria enalia]
MGCGPSKMKVRPVYKPLSDGPMVTRIFTPWGSRVRSPGEPMQIELHQTQDIGMTTALFVIRYNRDISGATEEIIINGHPILIPLSAAKALRNVFDNAAIINGLTAGWSAWFWMDCISINESDPAEAEKQRRMEPYIYTIAKWTLDCTGPIAQIKLGTNAYQSAVVNFGGPVENIIAMGESLDNAYRLTGHIPGRVVWTASH